ncbi:plasmid partitioning protein RepB C-terminal domain-containing protein [Proteus columbae]|uniref:plasmid partitioning protein RepB C-terminal domain-containing protein n=1 Tax=Proteus columbae TaxID=1987580 RepID=UPI0018C5FDE8|nr:plasmid partitioning protein RepB C-terminal domain-containing protein [Proteus columbae]MBG6029335.1 ParB N-terminal domain-containing protein [Proteus mirabilis]MBG6047226.1 ParB N-terminal domain-containing protein [Proteus mirabilis]
MINYLFKNNAINLNINLLNPSKLLPTNIKQSKKFLQIKKTLVCIGLIEPIIVYMDTIANKIIIIDGHLRIEALKDLGEKKVRCLISTVYDTYTPNNKVNRITIIEEQKMIEKAIKKGVSAETLSEALNISMESLKNKITILDNISPKVISLFSNQNIPKTTFYILKKMKEIRQIECAHLMLSLENFSVKLASSLLHKTESALLVLGRKEKAQQKEGHRKVIDRLEKELAQVHIENEKIKEIYAVNSIKLVIIKSNIKKLLDNPKVLHWLIDNKSDFLSELKLISNIENI